MFKALALASNLTSLHLSALVAGVVMLASGQETRAEVKHWAFESIARPDVPNVVDATWPRNPIDHFILYSLEQRGIQPSQPADPATLLRRLSLDLIGLPPTREELNAFLRAPQEEAVKQAVERLLASPHYGERWGRHWLDVARYADSAGYEFDSPRQMWKYRDWVIHAFNEDKPYDEFLREQLAGDLMGDNKEASIATGFICNSLKNYGDHAEATIDRVNAFGTAYLGITLGCAQCHDHKTDPISQKEYYQIFAFFNSGEDTELNFSSPAEVAEREAVEEAVALLKQKLADYQNGPDKDPLAWAAKLTGTQLRALPSELRQAIIRVSQDRTDEQKALLLAGHRDAVTRYQTDLENRIDEWSRHLTEEQRQALPREAQDYLQTARAERPSDRPVFLMQAYWPNDPGYVKRSEMIKELEAKIPQTITTLVMQQRPGPCETHVFLGGDNRALGERVSPGVPAVLPPLNAVGNEPSRLDLARWAVSRDNPLTARVAVNRIWQRFFGVGLVEASDNFGTQTAEPLHVQLLNWLASEFMDHSWSVKHIHRLIVESATYRQSSLSREDLLEIDPGNSLFARQQRLRLEAEIIRDSALAVSGLLNREVGGPSVFPYQPDGIMTGRADGATWKQDEGPNRYRRGMYIHYWRLTPHPFFRLFDAPDASASCTRRTRSNTPLQALTLLNDPWFAEAAVSLARKVVESQPNATTEERIQWTFEECLGRLPTDEEQSILVQLLNDEMETFQQQPARAVEILGSSEQQDAARIAAWTTVARTTLNLDEFITRE